MIEITNDPIRTGDIVDRLSWDGCGSVVVHFGVVKPEAEGRKSRGMRLAPDGDLASELAKIEAELRDLHPITDILIVRRMGELRVGDVIMAVAVASPAKDAAFAACDQAVRNLKQKRGLKKEELYE